MKNITAVLIDDGTLDTIIRVKEEGNEAREYRFNLEHEGTREEEISLCKELAIEAYYDDIDELV